MTIFRIIWACIKYPMLLIVEPHTTMRKAFLFSATFLYIAYTDFLKALKHGRITNAASIVLLLSIWAGIMMWIGFGFIYCCFCIIDATVNRINCGKWELSD